MSERNTRFNSKGKVYISEVPNTEALLKNLSASGLCIESQGFMDIIPKTRCSIDVIPEKDSNIDKFSLEIESRWVKAKMNSSESGFVIVVPSGTSGNALLEDYLQYLATRHNTETDETEKDS